MERSVWTDERISDMVAQHETQFELLRGEMRELRTEMREEFRAVRAEIADVRRSMTHLTIGMIGAFAAQYAALLVIALG